ncbi:DUF6527 family protein (plasmid) [Pantoea allii]|uniref:DUF6527 family protein n=1 Tax=Pantoea allii TaxID=574096 RepID=UPI0020B647B9|nr:DUF6527 family protein [Pantoea allii]
MGRFLAKLLKWTKIIDFDLLVRRSETFPLNKNIENEDIIFVVDGGIEKWACLKCPGNCGKTISLSLNQARRPRWTLIHDCLYRPTVKPSIHQKNGCGCHFWITKGKVEWCRGGRPEKE